MPSKEIETGSHGLASAVATFDVLVRALWVRVGLMRRRAFCRVTFAVLIR